MELVEPTVAYSKQKMSIEEYLDMENAADEKHEYYKGEICAMSGAKVPHNIIIHLPMLLSLRLLMKQYLFQKYMMMYALLNKMTS